MYKLQPSLIDASILNDLKKYTFKTRPISKKTKLNNIFSVFDNPKTTQRLFILFFFIIIALFLYSKYKTKKNNTNNYKFMYKAITY